MIVTESYTILERSVVQFFTDACYETQGRATHYIGIMITIFD